MTSTSISHVGTVLSEEIGTRLVRRLTLEQKVRLLTGASMWTLADEPTIGLSTVVVSDGPAGVRGVGWDERDPSASLPSPTAIAASWDLGLVGDLGRLIASEARRKRVHVVLGPTVNIQRSPRGGRHFEAYSEDPWLSGVVGAAFVRGVQSGGVAATAKHFVANDSETDRMTVDVDVDERTLREVYLLPFERIVTEGGAWVVMSSYNSVNGTTMTENPLLASPLKDEWGFDGVVVSDWMGVRDTEAAARAAQDLAMPGPHGVWGEALVAAVRSGAVEEAAIDAKVVRLLRLAGRVGALDAVAPVVPPAPAWLPDDVVGLLRRAAADGMVLVRNDGLLPLAPGSRLAVIGEHARWARNQGGGSAQVFPEHVVSPLDGIRAAFGEQHVSYVPGVRASDALLPLGPEVAVDPSTGAPGVHVRLLAADGTVRLEEHRGTGRLTWLGDDVLQGVSTVEVRADFVAPAAGTYQIGFAGLGDFRLEVDGRAVSDGLFLPEGTDPFVAFLAPPSQTFDIEMSEGQVVSLQLTHGVHLQEGFSAVMFTLGYREPFGTAEEELDRAVRAAAEADVAVVVVGTTERLESEGFDRPSLRLPDGQDEMVLRVLAANPRTVVLVNSGGPVVMPWLDEVPAVLLTWFPGQEMGSAIADVLSGAREPGGRMPTTWPTDEADVPVWQVEPVNGRLHYSEGVHVGYREWTRRAARGGPAPAIPFGHGLGYTTWRLSGASIAAADPRGAGVDVEVDVTNTGGRAGKQVVQAYVSRVSPSQVDRPALWLAGFALVHADAGQTVAARIHLEPRAFAHWSVDDHGWRTEPGTFAVRIGTSATDLVADLTVEVPRA